MKRLLKNFFDAQRHHFGPEGRLKRWFPFFESIETIFFAAPVVTANPPHTRDSLDVKRYMATVVFSLVPLLFFGIYNAGFQSRLAAGLSTDAWPVILSGAAAVLPLVIVSYVVGFGWEIVFAGVRGHEISEGVFVSAMLFPLTLPPTTPLWQAAVGISFGVVIGKEVFGGTGRNFLNPALTGRAFLYFAYPAHMSGDKVWTVISGAGQTVVDGFTAATPLAVVSGPGTGVTAERALSDAGYTVSKLFFGLYPDSIGASSAFLCLLSAVFLIACGIASYRIIAGGVIGILAMGALANLLAAEGSAAYTYMSMNPIYHLLTGGTAFGLAFMATDPVTAPDMKASKWIYGLAIGVLTVLVRVFNPAFPEGIMLAILLMNVFSPLIDMGMLRFHIRKRMPNV